MVEVIDIDTELPLMMRCPSHIEDLAGRSMGQWSVIGLAASSVDVALKRNSNYHWVCRCVCGGIKIITHSSLRSGNSKSCGCVSRRGYKDIIASRWNNIRNGANQREIPFLISIEEAWNLYEKQSGICALTGDSIRFDGTTKMASIDRINSDDHYRLSNINWVRSDVNLMKGALSLRSFVSWCRIISNHSKNR